MSQLTVVATVEAKPEHAATVEAELRKLVAPTLAEPGCIQYDLHQDLAVPHRFVFVERWESEELLEQHLAAPPLAAFDQATMGMIEWFDIKRLTLV